MSMSSQCPTSTKSSRPSSTIGLTRLWTASARIAVGRLTRKKLAWSVSMTVRHVSMRRLAMSATSYHQATAGLYSLNSGLNDDDLSSGCWPMAASILAASSAGGASAVARSIARRLGRSRQRLIKLTRLRPTGSTMIMIWQKGGKGWW